LLFSNSYSLFCILCKRDLYSSVSFSQYEFIFSLLSITHSIFMTVHGFSRWMLVSFMWIEVSFWYFGSLSTISHELYRHELYRHELYGTKNSIVTKIECAIDRRKFPDECWSLLCELRSLFDKMQFSLKRNIGLLLSALSEFIFSSVDSTFNLRYCAWLFKMNMGLF